MSNPTPQVPSTVNVNGSTYVLQSLDLCNAKSRGAAILALNATNASLSEQLTRASAAGDTALRKFDYVCQEHEKLAAENKASFAARKLLLDELAPMSVANLENDTIEGLVTKVLAKLKDTRGSMQTVVANLAAERAANASLRRSRKRDVEARAQGINEKEALRNANTLRAKERDTLQYILDGEHAELVSKVFPNGGALIKPAEVVGAVVREVESLRAEISRQSKLTQDIRRRVLTLVGAANPDKDTRGLRLAIDMMECNLLSFARTLDKMAPSTAMTRANLMSEKLKLVQAELERLREELNTTHKANEELLAERVRLRNSVSMKNLRIQELEQPPAEAGLHEEPAAKIPPTQAPTEAAIYALIEEFNKRVDALTGKKA